MLPSPFPSRFHGKCLRADCPHNGSIRRGDLIRWSKVKGATGLTWHAECHPDWLAQQAIGANSGVNSTSGVGRNPREQGPLFDAADEREEQDEMTIPAVDVHTAPRPNREPNQSDNYECTD